MPVDRRTFLTAAGAGALLGPTRLFAQPPATTAAVRLEAGRVLMDCAFADGQRWPFVIDTGGTLGLIRADLARTLGLRRIGAQRLRLRIGYRPYDIYEAREFLLGGTVRQGTITFAGVEGIFPQDHAGSLPAGILTELPSELALRRGQWRLWPDGAPARDGWTAYADAIREARVASGSPLLYADAEIGGATIRVGLDTGMPSSSYLYRAAAQRAGLMATDRWAPAPPNGTGRVVRARLGMAGIVTDNALLSLVDEPEWEEFSNGIIGLGLLQRYDIATDPARRATYLRPNGNAAAPERYNRFGAWLERRGNEVVLGTIGPGSPAALAGLQRGDRIIGMGFDALLAAIYQPAGTPLRLSIAGRGGRRDVTIVLADYL